MSVPLNDRDLEQRLLLEAYGCAHRLGQAIVAEERARGLYEGYRDGQQYADSGWPSLGEDRRRWEEATAEREAIERELLGR
jgi:hypothetical protein